MKIRNWVKQDTATATAGIITLGAAVSGSITMASAGVADGELVPYSIKDGSNRESGVGTYTASGTTLTRTYVRETLVAGTFNNTTATAITLSGSAVVSISPDKSTLMPMLSGFNAMGSNKYIRGAFKDGLTTTASFAVNRSYWSEFIVTGEVEISGLGYEITTTKTVGTTSHLGLYNFDGVTKTFTLVEQIAMPDLTTGVKTGTFSANRVLSPGVYGLAFGSDSDITVRTDLSRVMMIQNMGNGLTDAAVGFLSVSSYTAGSGLVASFGPLNHNDLRGANLPSVFAVGA